MCQEKKEEKELPALKTALTHRYNDSMDVLSDKQVKYHTRKRGRG